MSAQQWFDVYFFTSKPRKTYSFIILGKTTKSASCKISVQLSASRLHLQIGFVPPLFSSFPPQSSNALTPRNS